jgi:outer membrane lipoprotein SlyB
MASGDVLAIFTPQANEAPTSNPATFDTRNNIPVLDFDAGTDESAVFSGFLPASYAGGGLTVKIVFMATSATTGNMVWQAAIERMNTSESYRIKVNRDADSTTATDDATGDGELLRVVVSET